MNPKLTIPAIILGVLFLILGYVYVTNTGQNLPTWVPGYDASMTTVHVKHAIAAIILGLGSFVYAWFASGPKAAAK